MEKYRQSRRFFAVIVLTCFILSCFFTFFVASGENNLSEGQKTVPMWKWRQVIPSVYIETECMSTGQNLQDITNLMQFRHVKRNRTEGMTTFQSVFLCEAVILAGILLVSFFRTEILLWYQRKMIRSLQGQDGKK